MAGRKWIIQKTQTESQRNEDLEELFVFGYASKLFRDDEKASYVEDGRHLIPWMGDSRLQIDRYDGRGHLYDLDQHDADNVRYNRSPLSEEEQRIEALCDEERYLELRHDLLEKQMYEEEELKRLNEAVNEDYQYAAVGFNYEGHYDPSQPTDEQQQAESSTLEDEEPYEVPPALLPPDGIFVPKTVKIGAVLEKTAEFISRQGAQMEIMLKMKQKDNPVFSFLDFSDELNPFYKHVVKVIKSGKYKPKLQDRKRTMSEDDRDHHGDSYLHPSLSAAMKQPVLEEISSQGFLDSVKQKLPAGQIANTPYARLVSQMSKHTQGRNSPIQSQKPEKNLSSQPATHGDGDCGPLAPPPLPPFISTSDKHPPPPGVEPVQLPSDQPPPPGTVPPDPPLQSSQDSRSQSPVPHQLPSNSNHPEEDSHIVPPPPDLQPIIDKMASYVAKNGIEFEMVVKAKNDARFAFLHPWHMHFPYYAHKKELFLQEIEPPQNEEREEEEEEEVEEEETVIGAGMAMTNKAVSFSIRAKEQEPATLGSRPSFLYESSDEDGDGDKPMHQDSEDSSHPSEEKHATPCQSQIEKADKPEKPIPTIEEMERRMVEERLKDKLASAAREKLAQTSKESQLKAERKRKAAMFINMLKSGGGQGVGAAVGGPPVGLNHPGASDLGPLQGPVKEEIGSVAADFSPLGSRSNSPDPAMDSAKFAPSTSSSVPHISSKMTTSQTTQPRARSPPRMERLFRKDRRSRSRSRSQSPLWRKKSITPPSAYIRARRSPAKKIPTRSRSRSPHKRRSKSKSPLRQDRQRLRRSRSRSKPKFIRKSRSRSPSKSKNNSRRRSRSRSKSKLKMRPSSKERNRSKRSRSKSKSRSHRSKSRSPSSRKKSKKDKARSRSRSPSKKKSKKDKERSRSQSPSKKKSHKDKVKSSSRPRSPNKKKSKRDKDSSKDRPRSRSRTPHSRGSKKDKRRNKNGSESPKRSQGNRSWSASPVWGQAEKPDKRVEPGEEPTDEEPDVILIPGTPSPERPEDVQDTAVSSTSEEREMSKGNGDQVIPALASCQFSPVPAVAPAIEVSAVEVEDKTIEDNSSTNSDSGATNSPRSDTKVSKDLLSKVRAMLKASREVAMDELQSS